MSSFASLSQVRFGWVIFKTSRAQNPTLYTVDLMFKARTNQLSGICVRSYQWALDLNQTALGHTARRMR